MPVTLLIAGVAVAPPAEIKVSRFDLSKEPRRSASGTMILEYIATKRRVDLTWKYLPDDDLRTLLNILAANKPFFQLTYPDAGGQQSMTCYAGDIHTTLWHTVGGTRYWSEITIAFIEQ